MRKCKLVTNFATAHEVNNKKKESKLHCGERLMVGVRLHHLLFISVTDSRKVCKHFSHFIIKQLKRQRGLKGSASPGSRLSQPLPTLLLHALSSCTPSPRLSSLLTKTGNICTVMNFCNKLRRNFSLTKFCPFHYKDTPTHAHPTMKAL